MLNCRKWSRERFYADHGIDIPDEWQSVRPQERALRRHVICRERETTQETLASAADELTSHMDSLRITRTVSPLPAPLDRDGVIISIDDRHALHIPRRILDEAKALPSASQTVDGKEASVREVQVTV